MVRFVGKQRITDVVSEVHFAMVVATVRIMMVQVAGMVGLACVQMALLAVLLLRQVKAKFDRPVLCSICVYSTKLSHTTDAYAEANL